MTSPFTSAQAQAITASHSVAISAGAGSGKTRVLAERVVHLLDTGTAPGQIAAVTFTEAAAAELRERIGTYVEARAQRDPQRWADVQARLPLMHVSTIHGLCGRVARDHPVESGAGLNFRVLDEAETAEWLGEHLSFVLAELPVDVLLEVPGRIRADVIRALLNDPTSAVTALDVAARTAALDAGERARRAWEGVRPEWDAIQTTLARLSGPAGDVLELARQAAAHAGPAPVLGGLLRALRTALESVKGNVGRNWDSETKKTVTTALRALKDLANRDDLLGEATEASRAHDRAVLALWEIFTHVVARFAQLKGEQEVATFADLEVCADRALAFPQVREHYRARWTHLLLDEAQDTNPVQWRILRALAAEEVNLTVVGDEKQSIYAFRRADVGVFREARETVQQRGGEVILMGTSFRTHGGLVTAVNAFFASLMKGPDSSRPTAATFEPLDAHRSAHPAGEDAPSVEAHALLGEGAGVLRNAEANLIAGRIQALLVAGTVVYDREERVTRPLRLSDVALLFRARTNLVAYENALARAGLPYVVQGGRGLYDRPEVVDAVSLLRAVADPSEDVFLAAVLRGPHVHLTDQQLLDLGQLHTAGDSFWDAAQRSPDSQVQVAVQLIRELREASVTLSASQLLAEADARTGALLIHAAQPDGARRVANVRLFQGLLRRWAQEGRRDVVSAAEHLARLERLGAQAPEAVSPHPDAVQLMTIHGSKGLEFPVVIVADALRQGGGFGEAVRFDAQQGVALRLPRQEEDTPEWTALGLAETERDLSEAERIAYVAFTRAADLLILNVVSGTGPTAMKRFEEFVRHLPETGVARTYLSPDEVLAPAALTFATTGRRPTLDVKTGPGVILPGTLPVTALGTFLGCPRAFAYRHLEGRAPLVTLWSERHAAEATNPGGRLAGRQIGDAVHRALEHSWTVKDMSEKLAYFAAPDLKTVIELVQNMRKDVYAEVHDRPYQREKPIQVPLDGLTFEGIVDAFDPDGGLVL
ncbi:UvrD-helicase domain-containing protein, partial [Deinococcus sp.]|uniref:UvrD-helicase domain-containing protein n=1 Tax=Deinococcus sp. TaxID=47478 RepID=UPI002869810E